MVDSELTEEQTLLYKLIVKANEKQTLEIKNQLREEISGFSAALEEAKNEIKTLKSKNLYLERKLRKNNVVIFGVKNINKEELLTSTLTLLNDILNTNFNTKDINNIYKIGKNSEYSPIVVEFISYHTKLAIFKNKETLKKLKEKQISISDDLCKEDQETLKILKHHLKIAREQNQSAKIKNLKLIVDQRIFTVEDLEAIEQLNAEKNHQENSEESGDEIIEEDILSPGARNEKNTNPTKKKPNNRKPVAEKNLSQDIRKNKTKHYQYISPKNTRRNKK